MAARYELEPLSSEEAARWDELTTPYASRELFHRQAWLDYLAASRGVEIRKWAIRESGRTRGYFCGGILRKGPFRILGSPLKGWGTNFMGPVSEGQLDQAAFFTAVDQLAALEKLAMVEIESRLLDGAMLEDFRFQQATTFTFLVQLTPTTLDLVWQNLESTCRNRIRKALSAGLTAEDSDDPEVAKEFYGQYTDLMLQKKLVPPYPESCCTQLFQHLKEHGFLFALRVRDSESRLLATGLFPHDDRSMYFWGGASRRDGREECPNEFLHWSAIRLAVERGLREYNMCGNGRFKKKFGGVLVTLNRWHKCYSPAARWARRGYSFYFQKRIRLQGWWQKIAHQAKGD